MLLMLMIMPALLQRKTGMLITPTRPLSVSVLRALGVFSYGVHVVAGVLHKI